MTKRVLDDLVDYAHFASAAPPQSTDNAVLPTIKRYHEHMYNNGRELIGGCPGISVAIPWFSIS